MSEGFDFPEQTKAVYNIVKFLVDKKSLGEDPSLVEMIREDRKSVMPCRRRGGELDLEQLEWAREEGRWWFIGPITELKVNLSDKSVIDGGDTRLLNRMANDANFKLIIK